MVGGGCEHDQYHVETGELLVAWTDSGFCHLCVMALRAPGMRP